MTLDILGIDPSISRTAIAGGDTESHWVTPFPSKPAGKGVFERIHRYVKTIDRVTEVLWRREIANSLVMIEGYSYGSVSGGEKLGEYGGLLRMRLLPFASRIIEVAPTSLKKFAAGKGNVPKSIMCAEIAHRWGVQFSTDDEYDAFALFRLGLCVAGIVDPANKQQREVMDKFLTGVPR